MPTVMDADRTVGSMTNIFSVDVPGGRLAAERWAGSGPTLVLLHAGVVDRRAWTATADRLSDTYAVVAYDRRGFGASPPSPEPFTHVEDLRAVLDARGADQVWLVGSSQGGRSPWTQRWHTRTGSPGWYCSPRRSAAHPTSRPTPRPTG